MLCAEGPQDAGIPRVWNAKVGGYVVEEGWLQPMVRKYSAEPKFEVRYRKDLTSLPRAKYKKLAGHGEKARLARLAAEADECDLLIFMVDADSNVRQDWKRILDDVGLGFAAYPDGPPSVACVPMAASECWLLADASCWSQLGLKDVSILPSRPESIWGKRDDPNGGHPHRFFYRVCGVAGLADTPLTRVDLMERASLDEILAKCPISFSDFNNQIKACIGSI